MRKTSQDGGDSTSVTSGIENEIKKPGAIIKTKRNSIKRKVQNFSHESDDAVIEPLLQKDKEERDTTKQSAKFNPLSKTKTEASSERGNDKDKLISDSKLQKTALSNASDITDIILPTSNVKENTMSKVTNANVPIHNHMNTNVFSNHDGLKSFVVPKSQILVEIDGSKHVGYSPSPLIFTTAKIHTDGKTKHMEPVQMTPLPILSTIEVSVIKSGINTGETSGHVTSNSTADHIPQCKKNIIEHDPIRSFKTVNNISTQQKVTDTKKQISADVKGNMLDKSSMASSSNKETKLVQSNFSPTSVKDNPTEKKKEKEACHIKSPITQPTNLPTSKKVKTIVPNDSKSGPASIATTKTTNNYVKESGVFDQTIKKDKPDFRYAENKIDLNKTVKPDSLDSQKTKPSDNVNDSDKTSEEKPKETTHASFSGRQLQRQNIVLDKDDPISKLKPNNVSSTLSNDSEGFKSGECQKISTIEKTFSDKTTLPKSSDNSVPITSVTTVSINTSATDNKTYASKTISEAMNKKLTPITNNAAVNKIAASVVNTAVTNNTSASITTSALKSSLPTTSSANKTFNPLTTTSNTNNISAAINEVSAPLTTTAAIKTTSAAITTAMVINKPSVSIGVSMTVNRISTPSITTSAGNKISSSSTPTVASKKISTPTTTAAAGNKISSPATTNTAGNKIFSRSTTSVAGNKISAPSITTTIGKKISFPSTTTTVDIKISTPSTTTATDRKTSSPTTVTATCYKISTPSTTTAAGNKITNLITTTVATNKVSGSVITTVVDKKSISNSISSGKPITSSSSIKSTFSNTPITNPAIITTSSASKPLNTENYSSNASTIETIKPGITNENAPSKSQVTSSLNTKPTSSSATTKPAKVTTEATSSQRTTEAKSATVTTEKSVPSNTIPQPTVGKSTKNIPKSSTKNSSSTSISSTTTSGIPTNSTTSSTLASSGSSLKSAEANKKSDSKSKELSNGSKSFKA